MALKGSFSRGTPLQLALERGTRPGAKLDDELSQLGEYSIKSRSDAESICRLLGQCVREGENARDDSSLHALIGLFQEVEGCDCPAFSVMVELGTALLIALVDAGCEDESAIDPEDVLFALKILAIYGTHEGAEAVIRAAERPFEPDSYCWHLILEPYGEGHGQSDWLFRSLSDPLPEGFLALALCDSANTACDGNANLRHPFDNDAGKNQLERWLAERDRSRLIYAISAAAALAHVNNPGRDRLLRVALGHPSDEVRLEGAYTAARMGRDVGIESLSRFCLNVDWSMKARGYLVELEREDVIPAGALDLDFQAKAEFSRWLAHPNELGQPPDELEIVDHRELRWPPVFECIPLWLIKYCLHAVNELAGDEQGVGLVGGITFSLMGDKLEKRHPEDCYAIHCYWELEARGYLTEGEVEAGSTEYDGMLRQVTFDAFVSPRIVRVVEMAPELKYPQRLVALASAFRRDEPGWIVVDGPRSRWYPACEASADRGEKLIVMAHVGRALLGFGDEPIRR